MLRINNILLPVSYTEEDVKNEIKAKLKIGDFDIISYEIIKESIDAHKRGKVFKSVNVAVTLRGEKRFLGLPFVEKYEKYVYEYPPVARCKKRPVVVGSGPAGLFAGLILSVSGANPIILERGLDVDKRVKVISEFFSKGKLDTECNIQFGEGGAGTFSDGKLNTGTKDPRRQKVLEEFVSCGAPEEILISGKPHIGTDKLVDVMRNLRKKIVSYGGEFRFSCKLENLYIEKNHIRGIHTSQGEIDTDTVIIAIGHSARDTFKMLYDNGVFMTRKSFSVGVRIEHPQKVINESLYHEFSDILPAADYKAAVHLKDGRGVYTFCMCPGGEVVAAASEKYGVVTNGMSNFKRDGKNANSALLVSVLPTDFEGDDVFSGVNFQRKLEKSAYFMAGEGYKAPVQLVSDFLNQQKSTCLGNVEPSYPIGVTLSNLHNLFPEFISNSLRESIPLIGRRIRGFDMADAVLTAVESRSSSPVRIVRSESYQSNLYGLYPCGEGAGYAGGIMSAAVDGIRVAEAILMRKEF